MLRACRRRIQNRSDLVTSRSKLLAASARGTAKPGRVAPASNPCLARSASRMASPSSVVRFVHVKAPLDPWTVIPSAVLLRRAPGDASESGADTAEPMQRNSPDGVWSLA